MSRAMPAKDVLEREFLEIRAKVLELAASLDRLDRGAGEVTDDERWGLIQKGISVLLEPDEGRAERLQLLFSDAYQPGWQAPMSLEQSCE